MTEEEINELDNFLLSDACTEEALSIEEAHGYLTAIILTSPQEDKSEWWQAIWGEPHFHDEEQKRRLEGLLAAMYSDIAGILERREPFEPMVVEMEEEGQLVESYEGWCYGFMLAVEQNEAQWKALSKSAQGLLAPIAQLALLADNSEEEMSEEEYSQWVELIPGAVMGLYDFWHSG